MSNINALQAGAKGDGLIDDTQAIQAALDAICSGGGGRLLLPSGHSFLCGPLKIGSYTEIHIEIGAKLVAIADPKFYPDFGIPTEGEDGKKWLWAESAEHIAITGFGVIDGQGTSFMASRGKHIFRAIPGRPIVLNMESCQNVTLRDVTFKDAAFWTIHLVGCENVDISSIRILNDLRYPNNDGINPDRCRNVHITNCHIEAGDDAICLKSEGIFERYGACANIVVANCTLISTSSALKLGTGSYGIFQDIVFSNCVVRGSSRGVAFFMRDGGLIENISVSNIQIETRLFHSSWWGTAEPIYISVSKRFPHSPVGRIRNISFTNINCRSENGIYVGGWRDDSESIRNITFDNVKVTLVRSTNYARGFVDLRPTAVKLDRPPMPVASFRMHDASKVVLRNCIGTKPLLAHNRLVDLALWPEESGVTEESEFDGDSIETLSAKL
jgi:polygalacturonase